MTARPLQKLDREAAREVLGPWLSARMPQARDLAVVGLANAKAGNSAETILFEVSYVEDGRPRTQGLVLRRQFEGTDLFMNADLADQAAVLTAMGRQKGPPTPAVVGVERDSTVLGAPFLVMEKVEGRVVQQVPNYNKEGWLADLPVAERGAVWRNAIEAMAKLHLIDWRQDFAFMDDPARGPAGLERYFNYVEDWYAWAAAGREQPTADKALAWLRANKPKDETAGVMWGDATPANMLFAPDNSVAALLDWEMAGIGPGEADLGWWMFFDNLFTEGMGPATRLEGLPDRSEMIAIYEAASGRTVRNIDFYEVLAMVRLGMIYVRQCDRQVAFGTIPATSKAFMNNPIQGMVARRLGLPVPELGADFAEMVRVTKRTD